ncbi:MAG: ATP-binding protein [Anaerovoracaceae bacterium]
MNSKITRTVLKVAIIVLVLTSLLLTGVLYNYFNKIEFVRQREQLNIASAGVMLNGINYLKEIETEKYRITLIDEGGNVVFDNKADIAGMENHKNREEVREAIKKGYGKSTRTSETLQEKRLYSSKKLDNGMVLRLSVTQASVWALLADIMKWILIILIFTICISVLMAKKTSKAIVNPINTINLENPLDNNVYEEIEPLLARIDKQNNEIKLQSETILKKDEEAQAIRREFSANVSHELKTPLASIMGSAEIIANGIVKPEDTAEFGKRIYDESARLLNLIKDIIKISKLDEGKASCEFNLVNLDEICYQVVRDLEIKAVQKNIEIILEVDQIKMNGFASILHEIIYNLCDNGINYSLEGSKILVKIYETNEEIKVYIRDEGIGIEQEELPHIFERFYRVEKSHSKESGGTGLGLSIVKHGVAIHNGTIDVSSEIMKGTTFEITFAK